MESGFSLFGHNQETLVLTLLVLKLFCRILLLLQVSIDQITLRKKKITTLNNEKNNKKYIYRKVLVATWFGVGHSKHIRVFYWEVLSIFQALLAVSRIGDHNPMVMDVFDGGHGGCSGAQLPLSIQWSGLQCASLAGATPSKSLPSRVTEGVPRFYYCLL